MKKNPLLSLLITFTSLLFSVSPGRAQDAPELTLSLNKDFGYSLAGDIQGTFSMKVNGPENLTRVVFLIDGDAIGEDTEPPFRLQFNTSDFASGTHTFNATGYTSDGQELHSNQIKANFVTSEEGWKSAMDLVLPILGIVFGVMLLSFIVLWLLGRGKKETFPLGAPRNYGLLGGAICPKCGRPFSRHWWGLNLGLGKLDRCPHCGKWSLVRRASHEALSAAEAAELETAGGTERAPLLSEEERLRQDLEESRYEEM